MNVNEGNTGRKVLIADLPMMWPGDFRRFEKEGGIWGRQFRQRRRQLTFALSVSAASTLLGSWYVVMRRKNTLFVLFSTFTGFSVLGFCIGMSLAPLWYENIANNKETSMMRRVWWAKECAKHWDYSQVNEERWHAAYPKAVYPYKKIDGTAQTSSTPPPPHDYGVELDVAESDAKHVDPSRPPLSPVVQLASFAQRTSAHFFPSFSPQSSPALNNCASPPPAKQQQQQQELPLVPPPQQQQPQLNEFSWFHQRKQPGRPVRDSTYDGATSQPQCMPSLTESPRSSAAGPSSYHPAGSSAAVPYERHSPCISQREISERYVGSPRDPPSIGQAGSAAATPRSAPRDSSRKTLTPKLKGRIPPALKRDGVVGGTHSPAHQSNSTSPFYMGDGAHVSGDSLPDRANAAAATSNTNHNTITTNTTSAERRGAAAGSGQRQEESAFAARQPTQSHTADDDDAASASMSPPEAAGYPVNPDVRTAELTAFEEQPARGSGWGIPAVVVLRHRMGFSTVVLTPHQRRVYSRYDLENFVLYKEQKYNAVNVLWRFCMLLLLILTFCVFCLVFSTCTTEWVGVQHVDAYLAMGMFVACHGEGLGSCGKRVSSRLEWTVTDAVTGSILCTASAAFVRNYIGAMWAMVIVQLLCELIAIVLIAWIVIRPTRSRALISLFFALFLGTACGIVAVVLFHHYTSCLRRTCEGAHLTGKVCSVRWQYGYRLYIGSLAVHGVALLLSLCMHSFIHNIRTTARKQLRAERHRASRRHDEAEEYMVHLMDGPMDENEGSERDEEDGSGNDSGGEANGAGEGVRAAQPESPSEERRYAVTQRGERPQNADNNDHGNNFGEGAAAGTPPLSSHHDPEEPLGRSGMHVSFFGMPDNEDGHGAKKPVDGPIQQPKSATGAAAAGAAAVATPGSQQGPPSSLSVQNAGSLLHDSITGSRGDVGGVINVSGLTDHTELSRNSSLAGTRHRGEQQQQQQQQQQHQPQRQKRRHGRRHRSSPEYPTGSRHKPQHHHVASPSSKKRRSAEATEYKQARKRKRFIDRFLQREYDANYLTAAELGVPIPGATDWVYDDRSDMYYSFERNMFWDPLTREYYNCAFNTWQESPDQVVEVRDVLDYMMEDTLGSSGLEDAAGANSPVPPGGGRGDNMDGEDVDVSEGGDTNSNNSNNNVARHSDVEIDFHEESGHADNSQSARLHSKSTKEGTRTRGPSATSRRDLNDKSSATRGRQQDGDDERAFDDNNDDKS